MARASKSAAGPGERLAALPVDHDLTIEGGVRPLPVYVLHGRDLVQPKLVLWLDAATHMVRSFGLLDPEQVDREAEAVAGVFAEAVVAPVSAPPGGGAKRKKREAGASGGPKLPGHVRVSDDATAAAIGPSLGPLGVEVTREATLPGFEAAVSGLVASMGIDPDAPPPQPFAWDIDEALLPPLFAAAAGLWRRAPWDTLLDHPPIAIELGERGPADGVGTLFASILGAMGEVYGVALYHSADDYRAAAEQGGELPPPPEDADVAGLVETMRALGLPVDAALGGAGDDLIAEANTEPGPRAAVGEPIGRQDCLAVLFDTQDDADPTYVLWLRDHGLKLAAKNAIPTFLRTAREGGPRQPNERETRALTLALHALNRFFSRFGRSVEALAVATGGLTRTVEGTSGAEKLTVALTYPAPGFTVDEGMFDPLGVLAEGPERPVPADAKATLYRFKVELKEGLIPGYGYGEYGDIWRRVELRGDQTLHDLHLAIQKAFAFYNDHLYAFFLSNWAGDEKSEYGSPFSDSERDSLFALAALPLKPRKKFLYLFDFGDDWRFTVTTEAITPGGIEKKVRYPRVVESHGEAPVQYPPEEEEEGGGDTTDGEWFRPLGQ